MEALGRCGRDLQRIGTPPQSLTQLAHRQPGLLVVRQTLGCGQRLQQARRPAPGRARPPARGRTGARHPRRPTGEQHAPAGAAPPSASPWSSASSARARASCAGLAPSACQRASARCAPASSCTASASAVARSATSGSPESMRRLAIGASPRVLRSEWVSAISPASSCASTSWSLSGVATTSRLSGCGVDARIWVRLRRRSRWRSPRLSTPSRRRPQNAAVA